ncbi:MAG: beta-ketoacyl synthase N-terminal-like domain-containing protein [Anaerolineales bacterium]|jgi:acetyl-CoA C-acetyltransferase
MTPKNPSLPKHDVFVAGVGLTKVGEHWQTSLRELAFEAIRLAQMDAGGLMPQALYVANAFAPILSHQIQLGTLVADFSGLRGIEAVTIEAAGASGGMALRQAFLALMSGQFETALVVGVEKITDKIGSSVLSALASATDADYEAVHGITPTAQAALLMRRYLYEYKAPEDALAGFSINSHANAVTNPKAIFQRALSEKAYTKAAMICEPLNMMDAAPSIDGAAAVLLTRQSMLPRTSEWPRIRILGSASATSALALHDQPDVLTFTAAAEATHAAYAQCGLRPEDIDIFELHDRFSIFSALSLEAAGFAEKGQGWRLAHDGHISRQGRIPITTFGGSKARGDPGGATGVYQIAEVVLQIQGRAGENQVADAMIGMAQCLGGIGATACTHILGRESDDQGSIDSS